MAKIVAVIVDGGYLDKEFVLFRKLTAHNRIEVAHIRAVADSALDTAEELFRIYYYHCPPYTATE